MVKTGFANYKEECTRLAVASDKVYQLHAHARWFSPGTPASSTSKTVRHDIPEILLKVAFKTITSNSYYFICNNTWSQVSVIEKTCKKADKYFQDDQSTFM